MSSMMSNQLKENLDKLCLQGEQIQKYLNNHQNKLAQFKIQLTKPDVDLESLETSIDTLSKIYQDVEARFSQDFVELKYNFFPTNLNVSYSVKYAGGTSPSDLTLCHNSKFLLKGIRASLRKKIFASLLPRCTGVQEKDCVIAVDLKRMVVRGVVISVGSSQVVTLLDIDTGDFKMATVDNIYDLDEEAVSLYALCIRCSLEGDLTDLNKYWTTDLSYYFVSTLKYGELMLEANCIVVDESTFPPRFKVSVEVLVDDVVVMNVNRWVCDQLLPALKQESENCLDINKVIRGLPSSLLMPYLPTATDYSNLEVCSNMSGSNMNSSQIISSPDSSLRSSSSSDEFSVDIKIDPYNTPMFLQAPSTPTAAAPTPNQKEIDVFFTNTHMASPSSDSLEERRVSKCECGVDCAGLIGCDAPSELLLQNPKVPRITTVIPSLARIPNDTGGVLNETPTHDDVAHSPSEANPATSDPNTVITESTIAVEDSQPDFSDSKSTMNESNPGISESNIYESNPVISESNIYESNPVISESNIYESVISEFNIYDSNPVISESNIYESHPVISESNIYESKPVISEFQINESNPAVSESILAIESSQSKSAIVDWTVAPSETELGQSTPHVLNGEPFYYTMKNKSKSSLLPTPHNHRSLGSNRSDTEIRSGDSFYNKPNVVKYRSDNSLSSANYAPNGATNYHPGGRRPPPKSHLYTNLLPSYMEDSYDISGDTQYGMGGAYNEKSLGTGPNSRGEGISLKEEHFCQAEHLEKVQSVKLPGSVLMVEPGQDRKALVSFAESPGKFYVNMLEANIEHMDELEEALCKHYSIVSNLVSLVTIEEARFHLGDFVAAKWKTDNRWYRARVLDWNVCIKKSIAILYVDHGNVDLVPLDYIQPLMPSFAQYAPMAQPCHLANVVPANSNSWNEEAVAMFTKFCNKNNHETFSLTFQPSSSNDSSSSWSVILRNSAGECINDLLLSSGLATPTKLNGHASHAPLPIHTSDDTPTPAEPPMNTSDDTPAPPLLPTPPVDNKGLAGTNVVMQKLHQIVKNIEMCNSKALEIKTYEEKTDNLKPSNQKDTVDLGGTLNPCDQTDVDNKNMSRSSHDSFHTPSSSTPSPSTVAVAATIPQSNQFFPLSYDAHAASTTASVKTVPPVISATYPSSNLQDETRGIPISDLERERKSECLISPCEEQLEIVETSRMNNGTMFDTSHQDAECRQNSYVSRNDQRVAEDNEVNEVSNVSCIEDSNVSRSSSRMAENNECAVSRTSTVSRTSHRMLDDIEGRLSRNSNMSGVSTEQLQLVGQLLEQNIETVTRTLSQVIENQLTNVKSLANNETRMKRIEQLVAVKCAMKHSIEKTAEVDNVIDESKQDVALVTKDDSRDREPFQEERTSTADNVEIGHLNNRQAPSVSNIIQNVQTTSVDNIKRIVNQLNSPTSPRHVTPRVTQKICNTEKRVNMNKLCPKTNAARFALAGGEFVKSENDKPSERNETCLHGNRITRNKSNIYPTGSYDNRDRMYDTYKKTDEGKPVDIDENLTVDLLVSSSDSSVRRNEPQLKKSKKSRKLVQASFSTIVSTMKTNETEKQKMIEDYVQASLRQVELDRPDLLQETVDNNRDQVETNTTQEQAKLQLHVSHETRSMSEIERETLVSKDGGADEVNAQTIEDIPGDRNENFKGSGISKEVNAIVFEQNVYNDEGNTVFDSELNEKNFEKRIEEPSAINLSKDEQFKELSDEDDIPASTSTEYKVMHEMSVIKKKRTHKKSRSKSAKDHDQPAGPSLKTLAQKTNIFECLEKASNSTGVSSDGSPAAHHRNKATHLHEAAHSTPDQKSQNTHVADKGRLGTQSNKPNESSQDQKVEENDSFSTRKRVSTGASTAGSASNKNTHRNKSPHGRGGKTQEKWYWLTLKQELMLKNKVSNTIRVKVTRVSRVGEFYCQTMGVFPQYEQGFKLLFYSSNSSEVYSQLQPASAIRPGRLVMACDPKSNCWYRSEVLEQVETQDVYKVFFVDFGTETYVRGSGIREIQPDYTTIPYQAVHCQLHNVAVSQSPEFLESEDHINCFQVWTSLLKVGQEYKVKIMEVLESKTTVAVSIEVDDGFDMGQLLALQCYSPFVEVTTTSLQGPWADFVYDN